MLAILPFTKDKNNQMFVNTKVASFLRHLSIRYHNVNIYIVMPQRRISYAYCILAYRINKSYRTARYHLTLGVNSSIMGQSLMVFQPKVYINVMRYILICDHNLKF